MQRKTGVGNSLGGPIAGPAAGRRSGTIGWGGIGAILVFLMGLALSACGANRTTEGGGGGDGLGEDGDDAGDGGGTGDDGGIYYDDYVMQFGMNSAVMNWSSRAVIFADAMMRGAEFGMVESGVITWTNAPVIPLGQEPPLLGEGWPDFGAMVPGEKAGARLMNAMEGSMPDGRMTPYVVTWEGTGTCSISGMPAIGERNRTANRVEVVIDPTVAGGNAQIAMFIDDSSVQDPVRNVHVWLPGMEATKPLFWQPFVDMVEGMNHGNGPYSWRAVEWTRVLMYGRGSGNQLFTFDLDGMIYPHSPSQGTRRGMCPEFIVAFCNETQTNLHMPVPHRTDDMSEEDYVTFLTETFTRIRDGSPAVPGINGGQPFEGLDPNLVMTVELSCEIWNQGFPAYWWMQREAAARGISVSEQIASQYELVFDTADSVFSGTDAPRLRKYIAAFVADPTFVTGILTNLRPNFEVNAIGPATYFSPSNSVISGWMEDADSQTGDCPNCPTVEEVIAAARDRVEELRILVQVHRNIANNWTNPDGSNAALVLYEGGQSLVPGYQPWYPEANAAQVHPLMYDAYVLDLIPLLVDEGVDLIHWYSFMTDQDPLGGNGNGAFGTWNDMDQSITLPPPDVYVHEGVPKAAAIYKGPPLIE